MRGKEERDRGEKGEGEGGGVASSAGRIYIHLSLLLINQESPYRARKRIIRLERLIKLA